MNLTKEQQKEVDELFPRPKKDKRGNLVYPNKVLVKRTHKTTGEVMYLVLSKLLTSNNNNFTFSVVHDIEAEKQAVASRLFGKEATSRQLPDFVVQNEMAAQLEAMKKELEEAKKQLEQASAPKTKRKKKIEIPTENNE